MIKRQGHGARETFTVRKQSFGVGVERTFPLHSPKIEKLEVAARGDVRRAKLYYLRDRVGKRARVAERRWGIEDEMVVAAPRSPRRVDAEGVAVAEAEAEAGRAAAGGGARPEERRGSSRGPAEEREPSRGAGRRGRWGHGGGGAEEPEAEPEPSPRPTPPPTRLKKPESPAGPTADPGRAPRARRHRRARARAGARDPGLPRQAVPDPLRVDGADARRRPAGPRQPLRLPLHRPQDRRHRRLPSARRAPSSGAGGECGEPHAAGGQRLPDSRPRGVRA